VNKGGRDAAFLLSFVLLLPLREPR